MAQKRLTICALHLGVIAVIQGKEIGGSCSRHLGGGKCVQCAVEKS